MLFTIKPRRGRAISGHVRGAGGAIQTRERLERQIRLASKGRPLRIYEPGAGHALLLTRCTAQSDGPGTPIDLRGARIVSAEETP